VESQGTRFAFRKSGKENGVPLPDSRFHSIKIYPMQAVDMVNDHLVDCFRYREIRLASMIAMIFGVVVVVGVRLLRACSIHGFFPLERDGRTRFFPKFWPAIKLVALSDF
jgi:hypothetical protein